jgi:hypothetical protein
VDDEELFITIERDATQRVLRAGDLPFVTCVVFGYIRLAKKKVYNYSSLDSGVDKLKKRERARCLERKKEGQEIAKSIQQTTASELTTWTRYASRRLWWRRSRFIKRQDRCRGCKLRVGKDV